MTEPLPLILDGVTVRYGGRSKRRPPVTAVADLSLQLRAGEVVGLVGANGAGKTTLLELAAGALLPDSGRAEVFGISAGKRFPHRRVGFAPDAPSFPDTLTVMEVFDFYVALNGMERAQGAAALERMRGPLDLDPISDKRIGGLSRGNLLKVGLVQAMFRSPGLLLCDEPFGALDPVVQVGLRGLLRDEATRGAAVLVSSHQLDQVAKIADRVLVMDRGALAADLGTAELTAGFLAQLEVSALSPEAEARLRERWTFSVKSGSLLTVPWASDTPTAEELRHLLPEGSAIPKVVQVTPLSLEAILLSTLARN